MVVQVPPKNDSAKNRLTEVEGWLEADDQFFEAIDQILRDRITHIPRGESSIIWMWDCGAR